MKFKVFDFIPTLDRSVGIIARVCFALVKPAALWAAIKFDSDGGLLLSKVFLIGIIFMALTSTNAHKNYYRNKFDKNYKSSRYKVASEYFKYLEKLGYQLLPVIVIFFVVSFFSFGNLYVIWLGLIMGVAEKISDEGIRFTQYSLKNKKLLEWAFVKLVAAWLAIFFSFVNFGDIGIFFPLTLLLLVIIFGGMGPRFTITKTFKLFFFTPLKATKNAISFIYYDLKQISWIFTGVAFLNFDKWLIQFIEPQILPKYMFAAQIAGAFLMGQNMLILAPLRVKLINQNPISIPTLKNGSVAFSILATISGICIWYSGIQNRELIYIPFFLGSIYIITIPYLDRLYWIASDSIRLIIEFFLAIVFLIGALILYQLNFLTVIILIYLVFVLILRSLIVIYLVNKISKKKSIFET